MDVDLIGWVRVGLGGTYGCRCGILYTNLMGVAENCQNLKMAAIGRNM